MANLGTELRRLRHDRGWSLREVADKSGGVVSQGYIAQLEHGLDPRSKKPISPSPQVLKALASVYGVSYEYLMQLAGYLDPGKVDTVEEDWPEGVNFIRRASKELTPEMKRKMIRAMQQFLEDDEPNLPKE